ncbi:polymorphic toxin-type HINT domain-containing protein [Amycolatopsis sp. NPDC051128]|uniref:polymorphic toxin-type HINT domain-containing protein n=1 Tax=Amycolatopsis sp. NPDC051128 TaxID=3155412 RepID=UPI003416D0DF
MALVAGLAPGLAASPAAAAPAAAAADQPSERARAVQLWKTGGAGVEAAAEAALTGTDEDVHRFLTTDLAAVQDNDLWNEIGRFMLLGGANTRTAATATLDGNTDAKRQFLASGWQAPWKEDIRGKVGQVMAAAPVGSNVRTEGSKALDSDNVDTMLKFLSTGKDEAQDADDTIQVGRLMSAAGRGTRVWEAAQRALDGTIEDIHEFLRQGYQVAVQRDQEVLSVKSLAELAKQAGDQAALQMQAAKDAADAAVAAAAKAKEAAERAKRETDAAQGDADRAAQAAERAAAGARRAAEAAQAAISAAATANEAARIAANAASKAAAAAVAAGQAAARARDAAVQAGLDHGKADAARDAARTARQVAEAADTAAKASEAAGNAATAAGNAATAAGSAGANADAAAFAAGQAYQAALAAGANVAEAKAAADRARRAAAEANRASAAARNIAAGAAQAAREAHDAATSAAAHARAAADAADEAANAAWQADQAAGEAEAAAKAADQSAKEAQDAVDTATRIADTARNADAERLAQEKAAAIAEAQDAKSEEDEAKAKAEWKAGQAVDLDAEAQRLLTEARDPATPSAKVIENGRKAAARLGKSGGPWTRAAAEAALSGGEPDVEIFVATGQRLAAANDDRASVGAIADTTAKIPQRQAAITALGGDDALVKEFLRTRAYPGQFDDLLGEVRQIMLAAKEGSNVRTQASRAIDTNQVDALRAFLDTGQYVARDEDNRNEFRAVMACGDKCPEVNAVAQAALEGPASRFRRILDVEIPRARQRDADTAVHVAEIDGYLWNAKQSAATARSNAATAHEFAARARSAADEAQRYADEAGRQATKAGEFAQQAEDSADAAQRSADQAAESARQAAAAAAQANQAANSAAKSVAQAQVSASKANDYAADAAASAEKARSEALAANKSAGEAADEAAKAQKIAADKKLAEDQQKRTADEQRRQDQANNPNVGQPGSATDDDNEVLSGSDEDVLRLEGGQAAVDEYRKAMSDADKGVLDWILENGGKVILDIVGWEDARKCFTEGDIGGCIFTALNAIGPIRALKVAFKLPEAFSAGVKLVTGFHRFREAVAAGRAVVDRLGGKLRDVYQWLKNPCGPNSFTPDTPVLLADGSVKAIKAIRLGDVVLATNPVTGQTAGRPVTQLIPGSGEKNLVDVTVTGGGTVTATEGHPFWVDGNVWREAKDLGVGDKLRQPDGHWVTVTATHHWTAQQDVNNLTVDDIHTFYVLVGGIPVLVHNSGAKVCAIGAAGEAKIAAITGLPKNTKTITINTRRRIPDFLTLDRAGMATYLGESKNVAYQYLSTQLKDYLAEAARSGVKLQLFVRQRVNGKPGTVLSGPLEKLVNQGDIILHEVI